MGNNGVTRGVHENARARMRSVLAHDVPASLVVFLIALPLSLGIAIASGAPVMAGLVAAAVGGIVAGALGGSILQVSGPAAGLTVIVADINQQYGWEATCMITVAAGVLQIVFGMLRVARAALAVSPAIVHGMLAGVGIVIALSQLHVILGEEPQSKALDNIIDLPGQIASLHGHAALIGLLTIAVLIGWRWVPAKVRVVPGPLVAVLGATLLAIATGWDVETIALPDDPLGSLSGPALPDGGLQGIVVAIVTVALVGSVESLLSAVAVDRLHDGRRTRMDRELTGQGAANVVSGALGGYPVTGVIVRSSTNVAAGARSRASAILHGVWIVAFVATLAALLERIPLAALAALLVFVGCQMVDRHAVRTLARHGEIAIYAVTLTGVVMLNLIEGVLLGVALAILIALRRLSRMVASVERSGDRWHVMVEGSLTFLSVPRLSRALAEVPRGAQVDLDLNVDFMDHAAFDAIHEWRLSHERTGGRVDIDEIHEAWYGTGEERPSRKSTPSPSSRWFAPWAHRRETVVTPGSQALLTGVQEFHEHLAPSLKPFLRRLAREGQSPSHLFISCADSRLVPSLVTASGPGDLFCMRNVGNLVPPQGGESSVGAAVEFSVNQLAVDTITICGHSQCAACAAIGEGAPLGGSLERWLEHGRASLERSGGATGVELIHANIAQQLDHLRTYDCVREAEDAGRLRLMGLYFDIEIAQVSLLDPGAGAFVPVRAEALVR